jgi:hypothetical protein
MTTRAVWSGKFAQYATCRKNVRLVLWELASFTDGTGRGAHPGTRLLAQRCGVHTDTVTRALKWGRENEWLHRVRQGDFRKGEADLYRLAVPAEHATAPQQKGSQAAKPVPHQEGHTIETPLVGGLTQAESAELLRLTEEEQEFLAAGKQYAFPQRKFDRKGRLFRKHAVWMRKQEQPAQDNPIAQTPSIS